MRAACFLVICLLAFGLPCAKATDVATGGGAADPYTDRVRPRTPQDDRLYRAFGGEAAVARTAAGLARIVLEDRRVAHTFSETDMAHFQESFETQLCWLMGGPCVYAGPGMKATHAGFDIAPAQFNALVEDLQQAMRDAGVPFRAQNKLLAILAPMHRDIVAD